MSAAGLVPATVLVGNPRPGSRTRGVAEHTVAALSGGLAGHGLHLAGPEMIDLAHLGPSLMPRLRPGTGRMEPVEQAVAAVRGPGLLLVVSPTFKGSYTGLLKLFLDMMPREGFSPGTVAVPVMTAGWPQHRFVADAYLRPLLTELGAIVPTRGLVVMESEFDTLDTVVTTWAAAAVPVLAAVLATVCRPGTADPVVPARPRLLPVR